MAVWGLQDKGPRIENGGRASGRVFTRVKQTQLLLSIP